MLTTFVSKLIAVVATIAFAFVILIVTSAYISRSVQRQLERIEQEYVPKIALGPTMKRQFEELSRGYQDAVAAHDLEALARTDKSKDALQAPLETARGLVGASTADELASAIDDYHALAVAVSRRLIAGETGESLVTAMVSMQEKQRQVADLIESATAVPAGELATAFTAVAREQANGTTVRLLVSLACMAAVLSLTWWVGTGALRSLGSLTAGFERFEKGDLGETIPVTPDEFGAVARQANRMAEALRHSLAELEAFNYSVSHDLRAPLRPLDGFSQALLEDYGSQLPPKAQDYLGRIRTAAKRMSLLIEDMLQLSRLGRAELNLRPFDLAPIARAIVDELRRDEPTRTVEFSSAPEAAALGDSRLLRIVLENLLRNAWKFSRNTPDARIEFGVRTEDDRPVYFVRDNGAGFDPAFAHKLFQPFQRLHVPRDFEGTGIGLAIVQRIVRRHGGHVWADSSPGKGATFHFTLQDPEVRS